MRSDNYNLEQIDYGIKELINKTKTLKLYSMLMLIGTASHIIFTILILVMYRMFYYSISMTITTSIFFLVLFAAFRFDVLRRDGNTLFETISDELHASKTKEIDNYGFEDISFEARLALRSFTQHSDIPLLPGKYGPALICLTNFLLLIFSMIFLRKLMY